MEPMVCYECGTPISHVKELFDMLRRIKTVEYDQKNPTHIAKRWVNHDISIDLVDVFDALNIKRYCCRTHIMTAVNFHDLEYE